MMTIDDLAKLLDKKLDERFQLLEKRLVEVGEGMATKNDLKGLATKTELLDVKHQMATKDDVRAISNEVKDDIKVVQGDLKAVKGDIKRVEGRLVKIETNTDDLIEIVSSIASAIATGNELKKVEQRVDRIEDRLGLPR